MKPSLVDLGNDTLFSSRVAWLDVKFSIMEIILSSSILGFFSGLSFILHQHVRVPVKNYEMHIQDLEWTPESAKFNSYK